VQIPDELNVTLWIRVKGDADIGGTGVMGTLRILTWLDHTPMRLWLRGTVDAEEDKSDYSDFVGTFTNVFFNARQYGKCEIAGVGVKTFMYGAGILHNGSLEANKDRAKAGVFPGSDGIIKEADCRFNSKGEDTGKLGCSRISFHPIEVFLRPVREACGSTVIQLPKDKYVYPLAHRSGDKDVDGNQRDIFVVNRPNGWSGPAAHVLPDGRVQVTGAVRIRESEGEEAEFSSPFAFDVFGWPDAPDHCKAQRITGTSWDSTIPSRAYEDEYWHYYQGRGLLNSMWCRSDTSGSDEPKAGSGIGCKLEFRSITLQMTNR